MAKNKMPKFLGLFFILFSISTLFYRCASVQRPQGGPRDSAAPVLLKAMPKNLTRNFKSKEILLDFDEYFKLTNQYQEITIIPEPEKTPEIKVKLKRLQILLKDTLLKNTTYVINFGKAIADVNESNVLKNFTYVFSTGDKIDSLSIAGSVFDTEKNEREKEAMVFILPASQDTLPKRKKPSYYTSTDSSGNFKLNNLKEGSYRIYALKEETANRLYDNDKELIAFDARPIVLKKDTAGIKLNLFLQEPEKLRILDKRIDKDGKLFFTFNKPLTKGEIKIISPPALDAGKYVDFGTKKDTAKIYLKSMNFDTVNVAVINDNKPMDTITLKRSKNDKYIRTQALTYSIIDNKQKPGTDLKIQATYPLNKIDKSRILLNEDSVDVENFSVIQDSSSNVNFSIRYNWQQGAQYDITFIEGALTDFFGGQNKKLTRKFEVDNPNNYGNLSLNFTLVDTGKSYIIELLNEQKAVLKKDDITKNTVIKYNGYRAGKYQVKIIYDTNKDGRLSTGNVRLKQQPETFYIYPKDIVLRPNWDYEEKIEIPKTAPETSRNTSRTGPEVRPEGDAAPPKRP